MFVQYEDSDTAPPASPMSTASYPGCRSTRESLVCTLDAGHPRIHIADGISTRCGEWDDEDES